MNELDCCIVKDLLPLYIDDVLSPPLASWSKTTWSTARAAKPSRKVSARILYCPARRTYRQKMPKS